MVKIFRKGERIEYTQGDTFSIRISPEDGETFSAESTLEFIIADESSKKQALQSTYNLKDGVFDISFTKEDAKIPYGKYVYKMILRTVDGIIATQKSGVFEVIWGA